MSYQQPFDQTSGHANPPAAPAALQSGGFVYNNAEQLDRVLRVAKAFDGQDARCWLREPKNDFHRVGYTKQIGIPPDMFIRALDNLIPTSFIKKIEF
jgi:hypothetical protein